MIVIVLVIIIAISLLAFSPSSSHLNLIFLPQPHPLTSTSSSHPTQVWAIKEMQKKDLKKDEIDNLKDEVGCLAAVKIRG